MKRIALVAIVLIVGGVFVIPWTETYHSEVITKTEVVTEVKSDLTTRIEEAQAAAMGEVEAAAKAAYDEAKTQALKKIELDVTTAYRKEVEVKETQLEKEVGVY